MAIQIHAHKAAELQETRIYAAVATRIIKRHVMHGILLEPPCRACFSQLRNFLASLEGQREYQAYQQYLRENAEVERQ